MLPIDYLYRGAVRHPQAPAVVLPQETWSYAELARRVDALAAALQSLDPAPGSRVGVCAQVTVEHLLAILATLAAGKVWVPLNPRDGREDLDAKIAMARPGLLVADEAVLDRFGRPDGTPLILGETGGGAGGDTVAGLIARFDGKRPQRIPRDPADTQAIKFTGGTSGRPKGVLQPCRAWVTGAVCAVHAMGLTAADRYLMATPITHAASCYVLPMLMVGGALVFGAGQPKPAAIVEGFAAGRASLTFVPPTLLYALMEVPGVRDAPMPALRHLIYGGAPMPPERIAQAQEVFGPVVATSYGQTEAPQMIAIATGPETMRPENRASVGRPTLLTRVAVVDKQGTVLPPGETGEIVVGGDLVMTGYLDNPEETAKTLVDGWLHTGDVGLLDERDYLFIKDRLRDLVITGGFNVYPAEVEDVLVRHPQVAEACVFGRPDEKWGERVCAAVSLRPGAKLTAEDLIAWTKDKVGSVKAPKEVTLVERLPRSPVGKVLKREVRSLVEKLDGEKEEA
jgi:acyl-CoA synthetase (AMP-forming)/AMP-acid ligase II